MDPMTHGIAGLGLEAPAADGADCALKFLVTNNAAGSIIGKGGATITQLQEQASAKIKVANSSDMFPGTSERCVLVTGTQDAVLCAASLVVMKIQEAEQSGKEGEVDMNETFTVKMLVPNTSVGAIIGKGGENIVEMSQQCGAQMKVSSRDSPATMGLTERFVTVTSNLQQMNHALNLVVSKMQENPAAAQYQNMSTSYRTVAMPQQSAMAAVAISTGGPGAQTSVTISVLDSLVGYVVGKEGNTLREIQRQSGARIQMSKRGEYIPGTEARSVTLTGTPAAVQAAQLMISQKIQKAAIKAVGPASVQTY